MNANCKEYKQPIIIKKMPPQLVYELLEEKSDIIDYIDFSVGSLIDSYLIFNGDFQGTKFWETIEEQIHVYNCYLSLKIDITTLKEYNMIYILETYKNCYSSDYTIILTDDYIKEYEDIFYQEEEDF